MFLVSGGSSGGVGVGGGGVGDGGGSHRRIMVEAAWRSEASTSAFSLKPGNSMMPLRGLLFFLGLREDSGVVGGRAGLRMTKGERSYFPSFVIFSGM